MEINIWKDNKYIKALFYAAMAQTFLLDMQ